MAGADRRPKDLGRHPVGRLIGHSKALILFPPFWWFRARHFLAAEMGTCRAPMRADM
jgi:hypothetical protein